ncbi:hypothetical protein AB0I77_29270 [Streptomyces sp. NPDC050619]|uniref:hypothetical protein n=1 Tax=Streptomyces sp. NPDC050619 TaxID=3157214 RepID=UPI00344563B7
MSYELRAIIADSALLRVATREISAAGFAPLHGNLSLLPVTGDFFDAVTDGSSNRPLNFWGMPSGFDRRLALWSSTRPVAYVEAEYFGGTGEQQAAVWNSGTLTLGPLHLPEGSALPAGGGPISQALRYLGVRRAGAYDEFEAAGLDILVLSSLTCTDLHNSSGGRLTLPCCSLGWAERCRPGRGFSLACCRVQPPVRA